MLFPQNDCEICQCNNSGIVYLLSVHSTLQEYDLDELIA